MLTDRGPIEGRCPAQAIKGPDIESVVWDHVERILRDPGDVLEELNRKRELDSGSAIAEAERLTLESAMNDLAVRRKKAIGLNTRGRISDSELDELLEGMGQAQEQVKRRLSALHASLGEVQEPLDPDLFEELRFRLDIGLKETQRQGVVRLLLNQIAVHTDVAAEVTKAKVLIEYRFPGVVNTFLGTGSSHSLSCEEILALRIFCHAIGECQSDCL